MNNLDDYQFKNIDELHMDMSGVEKSTRTHLNNTLRDWFKEHDGVVWCSDTFIELFIFFGMVCSRYGYKLEFKRDGNVLNVRVNLDETL